MQPLAKELRHKINGDVWLEVYDEVWNEVKLSLKKIK